MVSETENLIIVYFKFQTPIILGHNRNQLHLHLYLHTHFTSLFFREAKFAKARFAAVALIDLQVATMWPALEVTASVVCRRFPVTVARDPPTPSLYPSPVSIDVLPTGYWNRTWLRVTAFVHPKLFHNATPNGATSINVLRVTLVY